MRTFEQVILIELVKCSHDFIDKVSPFGIFDLIAKNAFLALSVRLAAA